MLGKTPSAQTLKPRKIMVTCWLMTLINVETCHLKFKILTYCTCTALTRTFQQPLQNQSNRQTQTGYHMASTHAHWGIKSCLWSKVHRDYFNPKFANFTFKCTLWKQALNLVLIFWEVPFVRQLLELFTHCSTNRRQGNKLVESPSPARDCGSGISGYDCKQGW